jgi:hypothetical protein
MGLPTLDDLKSNNYRTWHDRRDDCLGTLQINVPRDGKAENAAFFLTMDHRDNTGPVQPFNCADRLGSPQGIPSPRE